MGNQPALWEALVVTARDDSLVYCMYFDYFLYWKTPGVWTALTSPFFAVTPPPPPQSCPFCLTWSLTPLYPPWQCGPAGFSGSPWSGCPGPTSWWRCPLPHWTAGFCDTPGWTHCFGGPYTGRYNKGRITTCIWMEKHTLRTKTLSCSYNVLADMKWARCTMFCSSIVIQ